MIQIIPPRRQFISTCPPHGDLQSGGVVNYRDLVVRALNPLISKLSLNVKHMLPDNLSPALWQKVYDRSEQFVGEYEGRSLGTDSWKESRSVVRAYVVSDMLRKLKQDPVNGIEHYSRPDGLLGSLVEVKGNGGRTWR